MFWFGSPTEAANEDEHRSLLECGETHSVWREKWFTRRAVHDPRFLQPFSPLRCLHRCKAARGTMPTPEPRWMGLTVGHEGLAGGKPEKAIQKSMRDRDVYQVSAYRPEH